MELNIRKLPFLGFRYHLKILDIDLEIYVKTFKHFSVTVFTIITPHLHIFIWPTSMVISIFGIFPSKLKLYSLLTVFQNKLQ